MIEVSLQSRPAVLEDHQQIANLMFFESHVHRHLDWRAPLDWLGSSYYWVMEENTRVLAVLASPQDPAGVAWIRLFAHARQLSLDDAWNTLWKEAKSDIAQQGGATVALIVMHPWMNDILTRNNFTHTQDIIMLEWKDAKAPDALQIDDINIRSMKSGDLQDVAELDAAAFAPLWQNPMSSLERALPQANFATVAEDELGLAGYQISTENPFGSHLARLAVRPDAQRRGIGSLIVNDLMRRAKSKNIARLTVNTQSDNLASIALYKKLSFVVTGEKFPVFCYSVSPERQGA